MNKDVVIDRINRAVLRLIARRRGSRAPTIQFDDTGVRAVVGAETSWSIPWSEIRRVTAFRSAGFVGEALVLGVEGNGEKRLVTEEQSGWQELLLALPVHLKGARRYQDWAPNVALGSDEPLMVFVRE